MRHPENAYKSHCQYIRPVNSDSLISGGPFTFNKHLVPSVAPARCRCQSSGGHGTAQRGDNVQ